MNRLFTSAVALVVFCQLSAPEHASAQTASPVGRKALSVEDATMLTWRLDTRGDGIAALRAIVADAPDDTNARFELGRVLTWDVRTRTEGVGLLRTAAEQSPERPDVAEALAEVLSWDTATRADAVRQLRRLVEREPARSSTRLKLAEVLSWEAATRDESRSLYRRILNENPDSVEAAVGLARVLSWSGRTDESRAWYQLVLARNPEQQAARVGIAELEGWSGQARASLKTLSLMPAGTIDTPDAFRVRAQAYSQIGRPARALEQYRRLLTLDPGNTTAQQASRLLQRGLRPTLEIATEGSTESGNPDSSRVETAAVPFRFVFHPNGSDAEVSVAGGQARYRNNRGSSRDRFAGAGADVPIGNRVRLGGEVLVHAFADADSTFTGRGQFQMALHDAVDLRVGAAREPLSSSRLSLAGDFVDGIFHGPSFVDQVMLAVGARGRGWDAWAQGTAGRIRGENLRDNGRQELYAGTGRTFHPGAVSIRPGYSLAWMSYDLNLDGYAEAIDGDGVNTPGIGGYFSPARFLNHMARLDVTLPIGESCLLIGGAGVGRQSVKELRAGGAAPLTTSSDAVLGFRARLGGRTSFGIQATYQDVASAFNRTVVRATVTQGF
jgi:tetratricopeptide (TPR) repeat protein